MHVRLGVRARVELAFALGGLAVSVFLATVSWNLTTTYLYSQREMNATRTALVSLEVLSGRLSDSDGPSPSALRQSVSAGNNALYVPAGSGQSVSTGAAPSASDLPQRLIETAAGGRAAQQRLIIDGQPVLAVALPAPPPGAVYVELFRLSVLDRVLTRLSWVLAITAALATLLAAGLGRWASRKTLRPMVTMIDAAGAVARGSLDTQVDAAGDPDLEPLAEAFNMTTAALRARIARDARFASDVSHELRSPLTTIINATELLGNRRNELSAEGKEALVLLTAQIQRFRELVEDLLEVSRDDQEPSVYLVPTQLAPVVARIADRRAGRPVAVVDPKAEGVVVEADVRRIERILGNLIDNAERHGGGVREVRVERIGDALRVVVRDEGPGVAPADRDHVFERFFRTAGSRATVPGSGLGLAIVAQHVRAHGGKAWVEDAAPTGSSFVVEIPTAVDA